MQIKFLAKNSAARTVLEICKKFQKHGFKAYLVGGAVRDMLLQKSNFDFDLATSATPQETKRLLRRMHLKFYELGEKFGTIGVSTGSSQDSKIEITTFRKESNYADSRHPKKVSFITSAKTDVQRRDLSINALLYDPLSGTIIDYVNGLKDIKEKKIAFIGSAIKRIKEDPLRMLRAVRLAVQLDFEIKANASSALKKQAWLINKIPAERIKFELDKIFSGANFVRAFELLDKLGLLKVLLPEVDNLKRVKQSKDFHAEGNAFVHTTKVLEFAAGRNEYNDLAMRYALLFHDLGKYGTAKNQPRSGRAHISFHGHSIKSAEIFLAIARRLKFTRRQKEKIYFLIKHHMDLLHIEPLKPKTLVKWAKNKDFLALIDLRIADSSGSFATDKRNRIIQRDLSGYKKLKNRWQKLNALSSRNLITGDEVIKLARLKAGPRIGNLLNEIKGQQLLGKIKNAQQARKYLQRMLQR